MKRKHKYIRPRLKVKDTRGKIVRGKGGKWVKGHSGNPSGVKAGSEVTLTELVSAIRSVEKKERKSLLQHLVSRAYKSDAALGILLKKLLPDLKAMEALIGSVEGKMSSADADNIRNKLRDRFKTSRVSEQQKQKPEE